MEQYMNENVFREYDIRGVVENDFNSELIISLGKAFGTFLKSMNHNSLSISGDVRNTTEKLKNEFIEGVLTTGIDVFDMGVLPTPVNYFSLFNSKIPNSVQITGSHNPAEYNGFKLSYNKKPFFGESIQVLKKIIKTKAYFESTNLGKYRKIEILNDYSVYIKNNININNNLHIAMDCGNAVAGVVAPALFRQMGIKVNELFCDINPNFPNHHPDPTVDSNLDDLSNLVVKEKCDLGVAYDGDADRIVAVDEKGSIIRSDILMSLFVKNIISDDDTVVYDVKCSKALEDTILDCKGIPIMWKTGHSHIKNKMIETKSKIGGEMSGHIFFADRYFGYDDGIYVSLRLIELLSEKKKKLSDLVSNIPKYISTPEIRIECEDDEVKKEICNQAIDYFSNNYECDMIDGVRINFSNGWGLVRSSNTQPVIVCRFESNSHENLSSIQSVVLNKLKDFGNIDV